MVGIRRRLGISPNVYAIVTRKFPLQLVFENDPNIEDAAFLIHRLPINITGEKFQNSVWCKKRDTIPNRIDGCNSVVPARRTPCDIFVNNKPDIERRGITIVANDKTARLFGKLEIYKYRRLSCSFHLLHHSAG